MSINSANIIWLKYVSTCFTSNLNLTLFYFSMAHKKEETYEGIDFEGIKDACGLETDEIKVLKICFNMFDFKDQGFLSGKSNFDI